MVRSASDRLLDDFLAEITDSAVSAVGRAAPGAATLDLELAVWREVRRTVRGAMSSGRAILVFTHRNTGPLHAEGPRSFVAVG